MLGLSVPLLGVENQTGFEGFGPGGLIIQLRSQTKLSFAVNLPGPVSGAALFLLMIL